MSASQKSAVSAGYTSFSSAAYSDLIDGSSTQRPSAYRRLRMRSTFPSTAGAGMPSAMEQTAPAV